MITAALGLDISDFSKKLKDAGGKVSQFASESGGIGSKISTGLGMAAAGVAAAGAIVSAAAMGMWKAMSEGGALVDLQENTGIGIEKLMQLKVAFEQAGLGAEEVGPTIAKMQKHIADAAEGNAAAAGTFQKLGVSLQELSVMSPEEQLKEIGEAVHKIENPALRSAAAMEVFGKKGSKLISLFGAGGLDDAAKALGNQGKIMAENAGVFDRVTDVLGTAAVKMQGFFVGMAGAIAPELMVAVEAFNQIDLSGIGAEIGSWAATILEAFNQGTLGELAKNSLIYAAAIAIDYLDRGFRGAIAAVGQTLVEIFSQLISPSFWDGLLSILLGIAEQFAGTILSAIPGMGKTGEMYKKRGQEFVASGAEVVNQRLAESAGAVGKATSEAFAAPGITDVAGAKDLMAETAGKLVADAATRSTAVREKYKAEVGPSEIMPIAPIRTGQAIVTSLGAMGGGFGGAGGGANPMLDQSRTQTSLLQQVVDNTRQFLAVMAPKNEQPLTVLS